MPSSLHAATTITQTFTVNTTIPDNSDHDLADYRTISAPGLTEIQSITGALNFTGGWNGDLYVHLTTIRASPCSSTAPVARAAIPMEQVPLA